ncbi:hypothetical protein HBI42_188540 [Parastagonospora nodorum]|nr:hypothetical protein HBI12_186390 [Parastagonospora nodorum]KAH6080696.1 hypothetical protein HBI66_068950 [Parastagonospora nodorum]KAH6083775.1 hypothetical protein HBI67_028560 [Parastagonospora nodorum]KAH6203522.1 hypothetical protein HBI43_208390 [Parastagonospora nodorum]KAH6246363.1 hypothetical protein HBI42_188540 [Parastagonospora nodorum]
MLYPNPKTPSPTNPSYLHPRYEIRTLTTAHAQWAAALIAHAYTFDSPVWPVLYPIDKSALMRAVFTACAYLVQHQIDSGMSFGVFDTEWTYSSHEAALAGGKLSWDEDMRDESGVVFLTGMDFPLVSVAMGFDACDALDIERLMPLLTTLPHFGLVDEILDEADERDPESWRATGRGQVLQMNATATRREYMGRGIVAELARWVMREADARGYRGIQITCWEDRVTRVWSEPESPYRGSVVSEFEMETWKDKVGKIAFRPCKQVANKCYVKLKPE